MTSIKEELLIKTVKRHPVLCDQCNKNYHDLCLCITRNKWERANQIVKSSGILGEYNVTEETDESNSIEEDMSVVYVGFSNNPWGSSSKLLEAHYLLHNSKRTKRGVFHLYNMVLCATGCDPLAFKGYGCYCGFLGSGYTVDGIDRCCKMHDWCYDRTNCPVYLEYFVPYLWKCYRRQPLCALGQARWSEWGICAERLCECDKQLAECLRRYPCPRTKAVCTSSPWRFLQNIFML